MNYPIWDRLLGSMSAGRGKSAEGDGYGPGGSPAMLGKVLLRVALAAGPVSRSEIIKGNMLSQPVLLAPGTVDKAVKALTGEGLILTDVDIKTSQPGPQTNPIRLDSDKWAIMGIHVDQQQKGAASLSGVICGLDRKPLCGPLTEKVPKAEGQHDLRGMAGAMRGLAVRLLEELPGPRKFLGVGVEIGGHVIDGVLKDSVHAGWPQDIKLCDQLTKELKKVPRLDEAPIVIENDVNALIIHGYYERSFDKCDVALVAVFRQGVGGGLLLDDRVYRGAGQMAAEPGHVAVEYPEDQGARLEQSTDAGDTFQDKCLCSMKGQAYGHVDTLAVPVRIEGQLALELNQKISLEKAAAAPKDRLHEGQNVLTKEAVVLRRAGRALGRCLAHMINILNPGQIVLRLPQALATPAPQSSGTEYLDAVEREVDRAYSTGPGDARGGDLRLDVHGYADDAQIAHDGAVAAATTVFNAFIEQTRK